MDLRDYVRLLRVRRLLIITCTLLGLAAAAAVTLAATPIYQAKARLFVSSSDSGSLGAAYTGSLFTQARVKSYVTLIDSPPVLQPVIEDLGLNLTTSQLAAKVSGDAPLDTVLMTVSANDESPAQAQRIANGVSDQLTEVINKLDTTGAGSLVKITVVQPAQLPGSPITPRRNLNLALGLLVGLAVGVGAAVAKEALDTTVKSVEELQESFGVSTLGVIASDPDTPKRPLIVHASPHAPRAEAFRQLRTNLQFVNVDAEPRSIVVTSAVPGEGKSTTACNLAITIAHSGVPVILVEGDLRRPKVAEYMGLEGAVGLTDLLIGRAEVEDVLQPWGGDGRLQVLLSGALPPNPSEVLGSHHMVEILRELESRALVIIDAPPLLPVTDAAVLSTVVSGTLVVVAANRTRRDQLNHAVEAIRSVGGVVFGAVLNMVPSKGPDAYRYGYGYGADYAYGPDEQAAARKKRPKRLDAPVPVRAGTPGARSSSAGE